MSTTAKDPATPISVAETDDDATTVSRRGFLRGLGGAGVLAAAAGTPLITPSAADAEVLGPGNAQTRAGEASRVRQRAARNARSPLPPQATNSDEMLYDDYRGSFFKTLPQNDLGEVDDAAYKALLTAFDSGSSDDFAAVPLSVQADRKLANPMAAFAFEMTGGDGHSSRIPAAPAFASAITAAEMAEVYWQALTRDVAFADYDSDPLIAAAVADVNAMSATVGPTDGGLVTPGTLFRGETVGDLTGPYISQFFWMNIPYGPSTIEPLYNQPVAGDDFMTTTTEWLAIQRGASPSASITFDPTPRYVHSNRGLGEWVHGDFSYQGYLNAALILLGMGSDVLSPRNPYLAVANQGAFVTFGGPQVLDLVAKAAVVSLKAAWYQKWLVHRRLRPEVYAARAEFQRNGTKDYGIHADILNSDAVARVLMAEGNILLPQAFPEGSPTHPSYPAGHATIAGACCTVLKAFFDEDYVLTDPVVATSDGLALDPWTGDDLTIGGEINKLAANISIGRDAAGVHYRSDGIDGITAGEQVAISMLADYSIVFAEAADGFELTRFDGQKILIANGTVSEI